MLLSRHLAAWSNLVTVHRLRLLLLLLRLLLLRFLARLLLLLHLRRIASYLAAKLVVKVRIVGHVGLPAEARELGKRDAIRR